MTAEPNRPPLMSTSVPAGFPTWVKFAETIMFTIGEVTLDVERGKEKLVVRYTPVENPDAPGRLKREKIGYPFFSVRIPIELHPVKVGVADRAGIRSGDILVVDRSLEPHDGSIVIACVDREFTVKYLRSDGKTWSLHPANRKYKPIFFSDGMELKLFGVVTALIHRFTTHFSSKGR